MIAGWRYSHIRPAAAIAAICSSLRSALRAAASTVFTGSPSACAASLTPNRAPERAQQMLLVADRLTRHHDQADRLIDDLLAHPSRHPAGVLAPLNRSTKLGPPLVQRVRDLLRRPRPPPPRRAHKPTWSTTAHQRQPPRLNPRRRLNRQGHHPLNASWTPERQRISPAGAVSCGSASSWGLEGRAKRSTKTPPAFFLHAGRQPGESPLRAESRPIADRLCRGRPGDGRLTRHLRQRSPRSRMPGSAAGSRRASADCRRA
jgi:hypothetical protein